LILPIFSGLSCTDICRDEIELFLTDLTENCQQIQHLDLSGSPVDARCCDLICDLEDLRALRLDDCPNVNTAAVVGVLDRRGENLVQFDCGNKLQEQLFGTLWYQDSRWSSKSIIFFHNISYS
jgi:hypothetical protein